MSKTQIDLKDHRMVAMSRHALNALRAALLRDVGPAGAAVLRDAGFAGGESVFQSFTEWLRGRTDVEADALSVEEFQQRAGEYFRDTGWGTLSLGTLHEVVVTVDSPDWEEAEPNGGLDHPGCHFTTGLFADFLGRVSDEPLAVLEVECRSMGSSRCRFLLGSADVMNYVFDALERGERYEDALMAVRTASAA
jgi:predicted hydrocarbon binding protein